MHYSQEVRESGEGQIRRLSFISVDAVIETVLLEHAPYFSYSVAPIKCRSNILLASLVLHPTEYASRKLAGN